MVAVPSRSAARDRTVRLIRLLKRVGGVRRRPVPRPVQPTAIRVAYRDAIVSLALAPAGDRVRAQLVPRLGAILAEHRTDAARADAPTDASELIDKIARDLQDQVLQPRAVEGLARQFAARTANFNKTQLDRQVRAAVGVDVFGAEPNLQPHEDRFVAENVALIKSIPTQYLDDVATTVARGVRSGQRAEDLAEDLVDRYGVSESRAGLIARDQVGKYNGELNKVRQQALGVEGFTWRTVHDDRVREEHALLDGEFFTWDSPPSEGIPGEPINCRCYAEPDFSELLDDASDESDDEQPDDTAKSVAQEVSEVVTPEVVTPEVVTPEEQEVPSNEEYAAAAARIADTSQPLQAEDVDAAQRQVASILDAAATVARRVGTLEFADTSGLGLVGYCSSDGSVTLSDSLRADFGRALEKLARNDHVLSASEQNALHAMVHESLHGRSPIADFDAYNDATVKQVEEISTELAARRVVRDQVRGGPVHWTAERAVQGAYGEYIRDVAGVIGGATGEDTAHVLERMENASLALKGAGPPAADLVRAFVDRLGVDAGVADTVYAQLRRKL